MILVKWSLRYYKAGSSDYNTNEGIGIVMGYVPYPTGTRVVVAPIGETHPIEVQLSDIEFVVGPEHGQSKIKRALKDLREPKPNKALKELMSTSKPSG